MSPPKKKCPNCGHHPPHCKCKHKKCQDCGHHHPHCKCKHKKCQECGHHHPHCKCKHKKCPDCGHHLDQCKCQHQTCQDCGKTGCSCKQEITQKVVLNINFATGGTGSTGAEFPSINFEFDPNNLPQSDQDINLRSGSKKDKDI